MQVGLHVCRFDFAGHPATIPEVLAATGRAAEEAGVADITFMDHWFQMEHFAPAGDPMLEGYTSLGFMAAHTSTLTLGLLVTGVTYRHPGLLAKIVATLDVLSGGRAQLGLGAAWYEREHLGLGVPFPPPGERLGRLEEALQICLQMWGDDDGPFEGRFYRLAETLCSPKPVTRPRPPIVVGGGGERRTLRLVARYADACNLFAAGTDAVAHKLDVLARHCEDAGRDPATVTRTVMAPGDPFADLDRFLRDMEAYAALGVSLVALIPSADPVAFTRRVGEEIVPRLAALGA